MITPDGDSITLLRYAPSVLHWFSLVTLFTESYFKQTDVTSEYKTPSIRFNPESSTANTFREVIGSPASSPHSIPATLSPAGRTPQPTPSPQPDSIIKNRDNVEQTNGGAGDGHQPRRGQCLSARDLPKQNPYKATGNPSKQNLYTATGNPSTQNPYRARESPKLNQYTTTENPPQQRLYTVTKNPIGPVTEERRIPFEAMVFQHDEGDDLTLKETGDNIALSLQPGIRRKSEAASIKAASM